MSDTEIAYSKVDQDHEHLRLLSIFHYVAAGILALFSMFPILHLVVGIAIVLGLFEDGRGGSPPRMFGWLFILLPAAFIFCGLALSSCVALAGRRLSQQQSYTFCLVIAALECVFMPVGTVLGVFTILVLMRPSVRYRFEHGHEDHLDPHARPSALPPC